MALIPSMSARCQWVQTNGPFSGEIVSLTALGSILFAGTEANGLFRSDDNGLTWKEASPDLNGYYMGGLLTIGTTLIANGRDKNGFGSSLLKSTDSGKTWKFSGAGIDGFAGYVVREGNLLFTDGGYDVLPNFYPYISRDSGRT